jgi:hypothetical protein
MVRFEAGSKPAMNNAAMTGGCACGQIRYRLQCRPIIVHCCHCTNCQRETGSAFAVNAMIETDRVSVLAGAPERVLTPSESGKGQVIVRCPSCRVAVWSHYAGAGEKIAFVRVGTLDAPATLPPDIHIFTRSKQPWVQLPSGVPSFEIYYDSERLWPADALARVQAVMAG